MKPTCIIALTMLTFCQSALAESIFYCVPKTKVGMTENGAATHQHPRFSMKIDFDNTNVRVVQFKGGEFFGTPVGGDLGAAKYRVAEYVDDRYWSAIAPDIRSKRVVYFEFPNLFASHTNYQYGALLHATCETF